MNQPASKEPTMDEILSSIRQIIADDDEAAAQKMPAPRAVAPRAVEPAPSVREPDVASFAAARPVIDPFSDDDEDEMAPLALSPEQIVAPDIEETETEVEEVATMPVTEPRDAKPELVVPDDVAFEQDRDEEPVVQFAANPVRETPEDKPQPDFAKAAPMPDADLSSDLAEKLLEPATSAAVRSAMSKLNTPKLTPELALGASGMTIEAMIREMLRPMLKDWLDENLPSMVERIVAQEIERVSRGG